MSSTEYAAVRHWTTPAAHECAECGEAWVFGAIGTGTGFGMKTRVVLRQSGIAVPTVMEDRKAGQ